MDSFKNFGDKLIGEFEQIGRMLSEKMARGIQNGSGAAQKALETMNDDLLESQQKYLAEKDKLEQKMEEAEEAKYQREFQQRLKKAKTAEQAEIIRQNESYRLQKKADEKYLKTLEEHLKNVEAKIKAQKKAIVNEFNEIAERAAKSLEELDQSKNKMTEKMTSYGSLFKVKKTTFLNSGFKGTKETYEDTLLDLSTYRANLENYSALLRKIKENGKIPVDLFRIIRDMPIDDAIRYQEALLSMDDESLSKYVDDWKAIQELSQNTAKESYAQETQDVLKTVTDEVQAWYGTIPDGFFEEGLLSAEAFRDGFLQKLQGIQEIMQNAVLSIFDNVMTQTAGEGGGMVNHVSNQNTVTYVLNSAGETVAEQLRSAQGHAAVSKLRGDYSGVSI